MEFELLETSVPMKVGKIVHVCRLTPGSVYKYLGQDYVIVDTSKEGTEWSDIDGLYGVNTETGEIVKLRTDAFVTIMAVTQFAGRTTYKAGWSHWN